MRSVTARPANREAGLPVQSSPQQPALRTINAVAQLLGHSALISTCLCTCSRGGRQGAARQQGEAPGARRSSRGATGSRSCSGSRARAGRARQALRPQQHAAGPCAPPRSSRCRAAEPRTGPGECAAAVQARQRPHARRPRLHGPHAAGCAAATRCHARTHACMQIWMEGHFSKLRGLHGWA